MNYDISTAWPILTTVLRPAFSSRFINISTISNLQNYYGDPKVPMTWYGVTITEEKTEEERNYGNDIKYLSVYSQIVIGKTVHYIY